MKKITGEEKFQILAHSFSVYSASAYTLYYSADGEHFTAWGEVTPAGECLVVNGIAKGMTFYLKDNIGEAKIMF